MTIDFRSLRRKAEAIAEPRKRYTADELLQRRAMPETDGEFIAAFSPSIVLDLLDMAEAWSGGDDRE